MHLLSNASGLQLKNKKKIKKNIMQYCKALQEVQPPNAVSSIASRVTVKWERVGQHHGAGTTVDDDDDDDEKVNMLS